MTTTEECTHDLPLRASLDRYVSERVQVGHFLTYLLENKLAETIGAADGTNAPLLTEYVNHVYWCLPSNCWGSPEKVADWLREDAG